jgi:hypothetical protein
MLRKLNFGIILLGVGVVVRSAAIFVPFDLWYRVVLWQVGELLFLGAWHFMFNHDFRELEEFAESQHKVEIPPMHDGPPTPANGV